MSLPRKFVDLLFYSNVWIGLCAVAQVQHTYLLTGIDRGLDIYTGFLFTSTMALYCLHRVIGIERITEFSVSGRFKIITKYKQHIIVYGILGLLGAAATFLFLPLEAWGLIAIPAVISVGYVTPIGSKRKRLRDRPVIKIFLIALNWSLLTAFVPAILYSEIGWTWALLILAERMCFTFALTIPFDIRDMTVDRPSGIMTIPHMAGVRRSKVIGTISIIASTLLASLLISAQVYPEVYVLPLLGFGLIATLVIWGANESRSDYYFAGLVDGVMIMGFVLLVAGRLIN